MSGCGRCDIGGHAMFCGCDCHEPERKRNAAHKRAHAALGTREPGPFPFADVTRDSTGAIVKVVSL